MFSLALVAGLGGLIYGSFLNVLLWRLPEGKNIHGRSQCRNCDQTLAWHDLFPVLSFVWLGGHCRYCQKSIHWRYPLVEIITGLILFLYLFFTQSVQALELAFYIFYLLILVSLLFFDLFYFILPDVIVVPGIIVAAAAVFLRPGVGLVFMSSLLMAAFFAILYLVSKGRQLGFGDVKLVFLIGLILGYPLGPLSLILGIWAGFIVAIVLLVLKRVSRKDPLPLGAFLAAAAIFCIIFQFKFLLLIRMFT